MIPFSSQSAPLPVSKPAVSQSVRPSSRFSWVKRKFVILFLLLLTSGGTALFFKWQMHRVHETAPQVFSGPWGDLQIWNILLEQPEEYVAFEHIPLDGPFWNFGKQTKESMVTILVGNGCTPEQAQSLLSCTKIQESGDLVINPNDETLLSLDPEARANVYLVLAQNPANRFQANPYLIPDGDLGRLLEKRVSSSDQVRNIMKKLLYQRNGYTYFSDPESVLRILPTKREQSEYLKVLTSLNVVMARLLITPHSNIDTPAIYWALTMPGVLLKDLRPMLEAQKQLPDGGAMSILYVLPPAARQHLYTTPLPPENGEKLPDCHWTALNFFNSTPDERISDPEYASQYIRSHYYEIGKPSLAGDLVFLLNGKGGVVHSAVYLASDIVYTKNGFNFGQPWVLMHEKDMIGSFSALEPLRVVYYRQRDF